MLREPGLQMFGTIPWLPTFEKRLERASSFMVEGHHGLTPPSSFWIPTLGQEHPLKALLPSQPKMWGSKQARRHKRKMMGTRF
ncbi:hypothetical protein NQ314_005824 [Rhamnusium bicolor]|uniref:Uncharacterized protein n=1 Tax=Rhamnusium bicolor TaxID=1586634 RepID=A0AAV8ZEB9_9CUCU|nr:hypothetical protein NQ314_005824 [Rhamnusium bicolor]